MKHGMTGTRLYNILKNMKKRCYCKENKDYKRYGGKACNPVTICPEWLGEHGAENFIKWAMANGYRDDLTIDRIEKTGNYEPSNCRWVDMKAQQNNRINNQVIEFNNEKKTIAQWSEYTGIKYKTLHKRIFTLHWDIERALTTR